MEEPENTIQEHRRKIPGYAGAIVANGFLIFALNNLYNWRVPFIIESYRECLWAINISLGAMIIANVVFIFFDRDWFKHLLQVFTSAASFMSLYVVNAIFPFAFPRPAWYLALKIFLIVSMVITAASVIYNIIRTIIPHRFKE
jgi:hypothetical protein